MTAEVVEAQAFARGGNDRVDVWAVPAPDEFGPAWQLWIGVHARGCYMEQAATAPPMGEKDTLEALRRVHGEVDRGGRSFSLWIDPEPPLP
jgi:hypothetical protein